VTLSSHHSIQLPSVMNRPERFNAKARRSSSAATSHKRGKQRHPKRQSVADTNPEILPRKSTEEKELDRREQLRNEVGVLPSTC
jgi:ATP-dependent RNA helicase DHX37/DHR1